jgi:hypothetical protein
MDKDLQLAWQVAETLNANRDCCFYRQVAVRPGSRAPLTEAGLCPRARADLGTSLVGLAKVGPDKPPEWLASCILVAIEALERAAPELLGEGKALTPPPNGTKGTANMLVGLGLALAYRLVATGREKPTPGDLTRLQTAAKSTLDLEMGRRGLSKPARRRLIGQFVRRFFADMPDLNMLDGIPEGLLTAVSTSAFGPPTDPVAVADPDTPSPRPPLKECKRQAAALLQDPEIAVLSDREIGRRCGLNGETVRNLRGDTPTVAKVTRGGQTFFQERRQ